MILCLKNQSILGGVDVFFDRWCICVESGTNGMYSPQQCMRPLYALNNPYQPGAPGFAPAQYSMPTVCFTNGFQGMLLDNEKQTPTRGPDFQKILRLF